MEEEITLYEYYPKHYDTTLAFNIFGTVKDGVFTCTYSFSYYDAVGNLVEEDNHKGEVFRKSGGYREKSSNFVYRYR